MATVATWQELMGRIQAAELAGVDWGACAAVLADGGRAYAMWSSLVYDPAADYATIREAAALAGCSHQQIQRWLDTGRLAYAIDPDAPRRQARRLIPRDHLTAFLARRGQLEPETASAS